MIIKQHNIKIKDIFEGFTDNGEDGVPHWGVDEE